MAATNKKALSSQQQTDLLATLQARFEKHPHRHKGVRWIEVLAKLEASPDALFSLNEMERTEGEPDVISCDAATGKFIFCDCSSESPKGRRSLCYDERALESRKLNKPEGSALGLAASMGIQILSEDDYRTLQTLGEFDLKTSSWINTPDRVRKLGGGLFCDRRYEQVFLYHNGAESYYAARGFRGKLTV